MTWEIVVWTAIVAVWTVGHALVNALEAKWSTHS